VAIFREQMTLENVRLSSLALSGLTFSILPAFFIWNIKFKPNVGAADIFLSK
jgi:hypothetical protein